MQEARIKQVRLVCVWENTFMEVAAGAQAPGGGESPEQRKRRPGALAAPRPPHLSLSLPRKHLSRSPGKVGRPGRLSQGRPSLGARGQEEFTLSLPRRKGGSLPPTR